jgi:hypothetical protein
MAQPTEHQAISWLRVRRPNTVPSSGARKVTQISAQSRMPSTFSARKAWPRSPSASAVRRRSASTRAAMASRRAGALTRTNRHGCIRPTEGAVCSDCISRARTSSLITPPGRKWRTSRRAAITRCRVSRSAGVKVLLPCWISGPVCSAGPDGADVSAVIAAVIERADPARTARPPPAGWTESTGAGRTRAADRAARWPPGDAGPGCG